MSKVLAICNRKGGCGKTTTAVNLAAEWGARGLRTLLVDLDAQGHAGIGFGIRAERNAPAAHGIFAKPGFDLIEAVRPTASANVALAPADVRFDGEARGADVSCLGRQLGRPAIADRFDVVILDTPPSLGPLLVNALAAADAALVPIVPHALSGEGIGQFMRLFFHLRSTLRPGLALLGVLPVMANPRIAHQRSVLGEVGRDYGAGRLLPPIRMDIQLAEAFAAREPIRHHAPRSRGAEDYGRLAEDLADLWRLRPAAPAPTHLETMGA
jgi:chromosome partitioning protein